MLSVSQLAEISISADLEALKTTTKKTLHYRQDGVLIKKNLQNGTHLKRLSISYLKTSYGNSISLKKESNLFLLLKDKK